MSTRFAIFKKDVPIKTDEHGAIVYPENKVFDNYSEQFEPAYEEGKDYREVAYISSNGCFWVDQTMDILSWYLPDDTPVYPLDNTAQGIYTIGDLKREIEK